MCQYFWIGLIDCMLKGKTLWMTKWQSNVEIFAIIKKMKKLNRVICSKHRKFEKP